MTAYDDSTGPSARSPRAPTMPVTSESDPATSIETPPEPAMCTEPHPSTRLEDAVHQRARLGILAVLCEVGRADFSYLKTTLGLTDGNLGRHLDVLDREGLIHLEKRGAGRASRTRASLTHEGRAAFRHEIRTLRDLVSRFDGQFDVEE